MVLVNEQPYPLSAFHKERGHVFLTGAPAQPQGETSRPFTQDTATNALHIPLVEERLRVGPRQVQTSDVLLHKTVETYAEATPLTLAHDELDVQHIAKNIPLAAPVAARDEGDILIVPIMQEVAVVTTQLMLVEEVHIRTRSVTTEQQIHATLRRERLTIETPDTNSLRSDSALP